MNMKTIVKEYQNFFKSMHRNIGLYLGIVFFTAVVSASYNVLFGIYMKNSGFNEAFVGRILALQTIGIALGAIPVSIVAQRYNKKRTLILGILLMLVSSFLILNIKIVALVEILAIFFGVGSATIMILQAPLIYEHTPDEHKVTAFSIAFVLRNVAMVFGSFVLGHLSQGLSEHFGASTGNWLVLNGATLLAICGLLIAFKITESNEEPKASIPLKEDFYAVWSGYKRMLKGAPLKYLSQVALVGLGAGMIVPFFGMYLKYTLTITDGEVGTIMAISQIGTVFGGLMVPPLAKRLGRVKTVILCQLLSIPFLISISFPQGIVVITISFFFRSSLMNMANPIIQSLAMEIVDSDTRTYMSGMVSLVNNLFRGIGIYIGGIVMYRFTYNTPYYFTILCYLIGTIIFYNVFKRRK